MTDDITHNLTVVREALEAEGLGVHVKLIDAAIEDVAGLHAWQRARLETDDLTQAELVSLRAQLASVTEDRDSLQQTFDLQWTADQRAIKGWQEANPGNDLVWPNRCCMVLWLMGRYAQALHRLASARKATIEECAVIADNLANWFGEHQAFLAEDAVDDCARKIRALSLTSAYRKDGE